jgi:hypothetical protein
MRLIRHGDSGECALTDQVAGVSDARFVSRRAVVPPELTRRSFTLIEAQQSGLTRWQLQGLSWRRLARGVYIWAGVTEPAKDAIATVRLPPGGVFSGRTATWLHGLDLTPGDPIEIIVPDSNGLSSRIGLSVRRAAVAADDVVLRRGFAVAADVLERLVRNRFARRIRAQFAKAWP